MSDAVAKLQEMTGHPVPQALLDLLASYPAELRAFGERAGFAAYEMPIYPDLGTLVAYNEEVRAEDIWTEAGPWPSDYLDLGAVMGGDHFALGVAETPPRVYRLNHEVGAFKCVAPTLGDFVEALLKLARGEVKSFPK